MSALDVERKGKDHKITGRELFSRPVFCFSYLINGDAGRLHLEQNSIREAIGRFAEVLARI